jgi:phytoene/squalene synthetase
MTAPMTPLGAAPEDLAEVEALVKAAGTSFYQGMRVLPSDRRSAMYAVYAFCRLVDDVADEPAPIEAKRTGLTAWRDAIAAVYRGAADSAVTRVLVLAVRQFGLRQEDFLAVIDGMQMDAETVIVAPDLATLDLYCDRVAAAVGRLSVRAFGDSSPMADVAEDAERGRLYLPREWLEEAGVPLDPAAALASPHLPVVCNRVLVWARELFAEAHRAMQGCDRRAMRPARLMGATYAALLDRLEARGWSNLGERVSLPKWRKLWIAARYLT